MVALVFQDLICWVANVDYICMPVPHGCFCISTPLICTLKTNKNHSRGDVFFKGNLVHNVKIVSTMVGEGVYEWELLK